MDLWHGGAAESTFRRATMFGTRNTAFFALAESANECREAWLDHTGWRICNLPVLPEKASLAGNQKRVGQSDDKHEQEPDNRPPSGDRSQTNRLCRRHSLRSYPLKQSFQVQSDLDVVPRQSKSFVKFPQNESSSDSPTPEQAHCELRAYSNRNTDSKQTVRMRCQTTATMWSLFSGLGQS